MSDPTMRIIRLLAFLYGEERAAQIWPALADRMAGYLTPPAPLSCAGRPHPPTPLSYQERGDVAPPSLAGKGAGWLGDIEQGAGGLGDIEQGAGGLGGTTNLTERDAILIT
ncbi:MAG: hypothetical protein ACUVR4_12980 [Anaerolineae bacterium]